MNTKRTHKLVHEGEYVAEVAVDLIYTDNGWSPYLSLWSPYLSLEDTYKLDEVRLALRQGDLDIAARLGRVYKLVPVAA